MFELRLLCPEDRVEAVSDALEALAALSISVEDADAQTDAEQALFGEPGMPPPKDGWQRSRVLALRVLGSALRAAGDEEGARSSYDEALAVARSTGQRSEIAATEALIAAGSTP